MSDSILIKAVEDGDIKFVPDNWKNTYFDWMRNIQDWCISRQIWWGHRIPAWYDTDGNIYVARDEAEVRSKYKLDDSIELSQDEDVLDTWFSSALWTFSTLGWHEQKKYFERFQPTDVLVTGFDIIFFWVARMIMAGLEFMDEVPFKDVYFTSMIRDDKGRKMSKSLGNSPDPIDTIEEYGADALRYTMIYLAPMGVDIRYDNKKCETGRNFANKVWNAARFRQMQGDLSPNWNDLDGVDAANLRPDDKWILARISETVASATKNLADFDFHAYALELYEFIWNEFCDWYVESAKSAFYSDDEGRKAATLSIFDHVFSRILRILNPVMPFITEELYHSLGYVEEADTIMVAQWPEAEDFGVDSETAELVKEKFEGGYSLTLTGFTAMKDCEVHINTTS